MKLSVSVPDEDVEFLDEYAETQGYASRSAVVHRAIRLLRATQLGNAYAEAWDSWSESGDDDVWDGSASDGLPN